MIKHVERDRVYYYATQEHLRMALVKTPFASRKLLEMAHVVVDLQSCSVIKNRDGVVIDMEPFSRYQPKYRPSLEDVFDRYFDALHQKNIAKSRAFDQYLNALHQENPTEGRT